jgi:O-antigen/teichoic acid export membrane protein
MANDFMKSSQQQTAAHGAVLVAAYIATSVLNYGFSVGLSWFFTPAEYGALGVAQSLLLLAALAVGSGFSWTANHDLAASGLNETTRRRFRAALLINALLGLLLALGLWAAYAGGALLLGAGYRVIVPLVGLTTALLALRAVLNGAARGLYAFKAVAMNLVGEVLVKLLVGLWLASLGAGATGVLVGFVAGAAVSLLHALWAVRSARLFQGGARLTAWLDRRIVGDTLPLFAGMLGVALMLNLDVLGLKLLNQGNRGDELAGFYQAAVVLARTPVFLAQALTLMLFSYAASHNPVGGSNGYFRLAVKSWVRLLLPGGLVLMLAPQAALRLFFPLRYQQGELALQIAALGGLLLALVTLLSGVLQASGRRSAAALAAGLAVAAQLGVLGWLAPAWGALGAALSLVAAGTVALLALTPALASFIDPVIDEPGSRRAWRALLARRMLHQAAALLALAAPLMLIPDSTRLQALLQFLLSGLAYLAVIAAAALRQPGMARNAAQPGQPHKPVVQRYSKIAALALAKALWGG